MSDDTREVPSHADHSPFNPVEVKPSIGKEISDETVDRPSVRGAKMAATKMGKDGRPTKCGDTMTKALVAVGTIVTDITGVGDNPVLGPTVVSPEGKNSCERVCPVNVMVVTLASSAGVIIGAKNRKSAE